MKILNVKISAFTKKEALNCLQKRQIIFTPNPEILLEAHKNRKYRKALKYGTVMLADGNGLMIVSSLLRIKSKSLRLILYPFSLALFLLWKTPFKKEIPEIIHGSDFMDDILDYAQKQTLSVFFLGAKPGVAKRTVENFKKKYPQLKVAGFSSQDPGEQAFTILLKSQADICFVAYGAPKQELWIAKYAHKLPQTRIIMGVGGAFDFWSGEVKRAPKIMRKLGLEWLWRLALQPKTRLKRIWNALVVFPLISLSSSS